MSDSLRPHESQHTRPPCPSPSPGVHSDSYPSSQWCHPAISSSVIPFSSCPQSLPASEFFPMSQFFTWGGQSTGISALASFLPKNTQGWSPLEWTGWISLQSKGLSRVFSNTTVQKHQFFGSQNFSRGRSEGLVVPSLSEFSTVYCDPHSQRLYGIKKFLYLLLNFSTDFLKIILHLYLFPNSPFLTLKSSPFLFWLRWVYLALCGLFLVIESGSYSLFWCVGFSSGWLLLWGICCRFMSFSS